MLQKFVPVLAFSLPLSALANNPNCETFPLNLKPDAESLEACTEIGFAGHAFFEVCDVETAQLKSAKGQEFTLSSRGNSIWDVQSANVTLALDTAKSRFQVSYHTVSCAGQITPQ